MNPDQELALRNALGTNIQMALPQTVQPVIKTQHQVQRTQYDPEKLQALVSALTSPRKKQQIEKDKWELLGNALASNIVSPEFEGAYGVKFTNPYLDALASGVNVFNSIYGAQQQQARDLANQDIELENQAREDAIKAAQLEAEATKQAITDQEALDWMKVNDPNGKGAQEANSGITGFLNASSVDEPVSELNEKAGRWSTNKYNPSDPNQGWWSKVGIKAQGGKDYGVAASEENVDENVKAFQKFETAALQGMFDVLKYLRPATDTDVMTSLRVAGADPTLTPEVRDQRLTRVLNGELEKANLPKIKNLKEWDELVKKIKGQPTTNNQMQTSNQNGKKLTADDIWKQLGE